jgi:NAD(P)-dependent dehydrogenase (short-subunit alcohol dehydrogenase family)
MRFVTGGGSGIVEATVKTLAEGGASVVIVDLDDTGGRPRCRTGEHPGVRERQAKLQYEQGVLTALREVSDALIMLGKLSEAETGQARSEKALEQAVEHASDPYRHGFGSYYEVPRGPAAALPSAEHAGPDPARSPTRARPALQGARGRLEPDRCSARTR